MKILICVKQVPDTMDVKLSGDYTQERSFVAQIMNLADESALEFGLSLRDQHGGTVTVITMGPDRSASTLREAIARGADQGVLLTSPAFAGADTLVTARCLTAAASTLGGFDLILCGRRASDGETGQVGPMIASMLQIPCVTNATKAVLQDDRVQIDQLIETGTITWKAPLPALIAFCEWSYRLRLSTISGMQRAAKVKLLRLSPADISVTQCGIAASPTRVVRVSPHLIGLRPCQKMPVADVIAALEAKAVLP